MISNMAHENFVRQFFKASRFRFIKVLFQKKMKTLFYKDPDPDQDPFFEIMKSWIWIKIAVQHAENSSSAKLQLSLLCYQNGIY